MIDQEVLHAAMDQMNDRVPGSAAMAKAISQLLPGREEGPQFKLALVFIIATMASTRAPEEAESYIDDAAHIAKRMVVNLRAMQTEYDAGRDRKTAN